MNLMRPELVISANYRLMRKIGSSSLGDIHLGRNMSTGEEIVIKMKLIKARHPQLIHESKLYKLSQAGIGMPHCRWYGTERDPDSKQLVKVEPREIFAKEFPSHYSNGKFISRISYVDFIDEALDKLKDLNLQEDLEAYKELLRVFPPGKYSPKSVWDIGLHHAPQQLAAVRLLHQMATNMVIPDKETELLVIQAFSKSSVVWQKVARMTYWSMKSRNLDPSPLPETIPDKPHELAKVAIVRMQNDPKSVITVTNTSSLPDAIDRTWIVFSQSPQQQSIIDKLNDKSILYLEESGLSYVKDKYLSYFTLKFYLDEKTVKEQDKVPEPDYNYNTLKMKFYGKPIREKLADMDKMHYMDGSYVLAIAITGTSSHDSVLSWLKILQRRNPKLKNLNVVFRLNRPTMDITNPNSEQSSERGERTASN